MMGKNKLLLFICACIPGCGQMYQGYMKRGTSLMLAFCALIAVCSFLYIGELALFLPVLWLYAFFDAYNLRTALQAGYEPDDAMLFGFVSADAQRFRALFGVHRSLVGWALVLGGFYALYQSVLRDPLRMLFESIGLHWLADALYYSWPRLVGIILIIALGIWFIRGPKQPEDAEFQSFTPPDSAPTGAAPDGSPTYQSVIDGVERFIHADGPQASPDAASEPSVPPEEARHADE